MEPHGRRRGTRLPPHSRFGKFFGEAEHLLLGARNARHKQGCDRLGHRHVALSLGRRQKKSPMT